MVNGEWLRRERAVCVVLSIAKDLHLLFIR